MDMYTEIMDTYLKSFVMLIVFSIVLVQLFKTVFLSSNAAKLPPSPWRFPVIGNLHQLGRSPHRSLAALSHKYGPLMLLKLGQTPTLIVSCPEMVKEIVKSHDVIFSDRPKSTATDILFHGGRNMAFSSYGKFWRELRKFCNLWLLSPKRVQSFDPVREDEVSAMLGRVQQACGTNEAVNLSEILISTSNNFMLRCIFGRLYSTIEDSGRKLPALFHRISENIMEVSVGDFFPGMWWVDDIRGYTGRLKSTSKELDEFYSQVIQEHKAMSSRIGSADNEHEDFMDVLLQLDYRRMTDVADLTHEQYVKIVVQDMLLGGMETTSTTTVWMMAELLRNPRVMKKVQQEIRRVVGNKGKIEPGDIDQMNYFKCVVTETLRLHPAAPLLVPRETSEDIQIRGYTIPAKTTVLINGWAIQRDPQWWDRPEEFVPERFEKGPIDFKGSESFEFIAFGFGRRICPGMTFGMVSVEYVVANLLYCFDWKLLANLPEELDMTESAGLGVHKKNPIYVVPVQYSP